MNSVNDCHRSQTVFPRSHSYLFVDLRAQASYPWAALPPYKVPLKAANWADPIPLDISGFS